MDSAPSGALSAQREKYWGELTTDEKVERMRTIIKRLQDSVDEDYGLLHRLHDAFTDHEHGATGVPMIQMKRDNLEFTRPGRSYDRNRIRGSYEQEKNGEVYF